MFKDAVKSLRKEMGLTQTELAEIVGFTHVAVVKWENGQREPDFSTLMKLASYFNVSADYLLGLTDERKPLHPAPTDDAESSYTKLIKQYGSLFADADFVKMAQLYAIASDAKKKGILIGAFLATAKSIGVDTSVIGY